MGQGTELYLDRLNGDDSYRTAKKNVNVKRKYPEYGVFNWLMLRHIKDVPVNEKKAEDIILLYNTQIKLTSLNSNLKREDIINQLCEVITNDFNSFKEWFNTNNKSL